MAVAKIRGGDQVLFYTEEMELELQSNPEGDEKGKILEEYFKSDAVDEMVAELGGVPQEDEITGLRNAFDALVQKPEPQVGVAPEVKAKVLQIVEYLQNNKPTLEAIRQQNPQLYASIHSLVTTMVELTRGQSVGLDVEKAGFKGSKHILNSLPVGSTVDSGPTGDRRSAGKVKVLNADGQPVWISARAGLIMGPNGQPTSAKNPGGLKGKDDEQQS